MAFFKRKKESLKKKDAAFRQKIAEANRTMDELDFRIADFKRKYQNLRMRGPQAQSISELEWNLREMHMMAERAEALVKECQIDHEDCVKIVEDMTKEFEESLAELKQE